MLYVRSYWVFDVLRVGCDGDVNLEDLEGFVRLRGEDRDEQCRGGLQAWKNGRMERLGILDGNGMSDEG